MEIKTKDGHIIKLEFAHYGENRPLNATDNELKVAELVLGMLPPSDDYDIVRKSNDYITVIKGEWDVVRIKFTEKARWVNIPGVDKGGTKRRIENVEDVERFRDELLKSYEYILKYS